MQTNTMLDEFIWAQRYRPKKIDDCILPESTKTLFKGYIAKGKLPHFLFASTQGGMGKTTSALALAEEMNLDVMFINGSEESGIDTLRGKIKNYAHTVSLSGKGKVIILDEADNLTPAAQSALRGLMEEFSSNCTFILTCNHKNKIIPQIRESRCEEVDFRISPDERKDLAIQFCKRMFEILTQEGVEFDKQVVVKLVQNNFPDFRKTLNKFQSASLSGKIDSSSLIDLTEENYKELFKSLKNKEFTEVRKWVALNAESADLYRILYDKSVELLKVESVPQLILILADYQYKESFVVDKEINTMSCLIEVMRDCTFK